MADTRQKKRNSGTKPAVVWVASAAALLIASLLMLAGTFLGGQSAEEALNTHRRVEFDLGYSNGEVRLSNLKGETINRETALAMAELAQQRASGQPEALTGSEALPPTEDETPAPVVPEPMPEQPDTAAPAPVPQDKAEDEAEAKAENAPAAEAPAEKTAEATEQPATPAPVEAAPPASTVEEEAPAAPPPSEEPAITLAPVEEQTAQGILPVIAPDGTKPWNYFAKKAASGSPRIAVVVSQLGLSAQHTQDAIALPPAVSLSFSPYGREGMAALAEAASAAGHELLLDLPMQTARFPADDPGPYGIRTDLDASENLARLTAVLGKARGYVGLMGTSRDVVGNEAAKIVPLIQELERRGLLFVAGHAQPPAGMFRIQRKATVPVLLTDVVLDERITETHIRNQLARAEDRARTVGSALVLGRSYPLTVELLAEWLATLPGKGFVVVPVSALGQAG